MKKKVEPPVCDECGFPAAASGICETCRPLGVLAVLAQKGGAGKTSTAVFLASEAARLGRRVLVIDADSQGSAQTWADVGREKGRQAVPVLTGHPEAAVAERGRYDLVIIDCPPRLADVMNAALAVADLVVIPCDGSADVWALGAVLPLLQAVQGARPQLQARLLLARVGAARVRKALATLRAVGIPVLEGEVPRAARAVVAPRGREVPESCPLALRERAAYKDALIEGRSPPSTTPAAVELAAVCAAVVAVMKDKRP